MPRASPRPNLVLDPLDKLLRERLTFKQLHEQNNPLVSSRGYELTHSETVDDGVRLVSRLG